MSACLCARCAGTSVQSGSVNWMYSVAGQWLLRVVQRYSDTRATMMKLLIRLVSAIHRSSAVLYVRLDYFLTEDRYIAYTPCMRVL
jgi:hypothetical protein